MTDAKPDVASLPAKLTRLVTRLRDGDWNMRTPEELAECVADAIMEALTPAGEGGLPELVERDQVVRIRYLDDQERRCTAYKTGQEIGDALSRRLTTPEQPCPKCAKTFTGYCDSCAAKLDEQHGWTPDVAEQPGSSVQGEVVGEVYLDDGRVAGYQQFQPSRQVRWKNYKIPPVGTKLYIPPPAPAAEQEVPSPLGDWHEPGVAPAAEQGECNDPDCGCKTPAFSAPMEALRFLSARMMWAGVSKGVAKSYARDIDAILATQPEARGVEGICKGTNCSASKENGHRHSSECLFDHARAVASGVESFALGITLNDDISYVDWRGQRIDLAAASAAAQTSVPGVFSQMSIGDDPVFPTTEKSP